MHAGAAMRKPATASQPPFALILPGTDGVAWLSLAWPYRGAPGAITACPSRSFCLFSTGLRSLLFGPASHTPELKAKNSGNRD